MTNEPDPAQIRQIAVNLATRAGQLLLNRLPGVIQTKSSPTDPATEADQAAEDLIFSELMKLRPEDSIISEEGSKNLGTSGVNWVVDPLDGTVNYIYGIPQWCVSIGVEGTLRLGVIYDPSRDEIFCDNDTLIPSEKTHLADALIGTGFSYSAELRAEQAEVVTRLIPRVRDIRRAGSCALDLAWVACGRLDGFYERGVKHWDTSAGLAIVEGAGGVVHVEGDITLAAGTEELLGRLKGLVLG